MALRRALAWCFLYQPPRSGDLLSGRTGGWLALYGLASWAYRCFASLAIAWFCYQALKPYRLELLAWGLAGIMLATLAVTPLRTALHFAGRPTATGNLHWPRLGLAAVLLLLAGLALWHVPLPQRLHVPALVEPAGARRIYVSVPGTLTSAAQIGTPIEAENQLAQLTNLEMEFEIAKLRGERNEQRTRLANLRRQQIDEPQAASEIPTADAALTDLERRLESGSPKQRRLSIASPAGGTVLPAQIDACSRRGASCRAGREIRWTAKTAAATWKPALCCAWSAIRTGSKHCCWSTKIRFPWSVAGKASKCCSTNCRTGNCRASSANSRKSTHTSCRRS